MKSITGIKTVCVVGSGTIGLSWAIVFARAGLDVHILENDLQRARTVPERLAKPLGTLEKVGMTDGLSYEDFLARIAVYSKLEEALIDVEYVQECVPEDLELKQQIFAELDAAAPAGVILASSASGYLMTSIAARVDHHAERCLVVHPTNPPHIVPLVELVPGAKTANHVISASLEFMTALGQEPIVCKKEILGFVLNRLQFALEREAFFLARNGVASVEDIDRSITEGLGLRWALLGPFAVEETNGESIEEDLRKFNTSMRLLMKDVCQPFDGPDEEDMQRAIAGVDYVFKGRTHDELLSYRDESVLAIRRLKSELEIDADSVDASREEG